MYTYIYIEREITYIHILYIQINTCVYIYIYIYIYGREARGRESGRPRRRQLELLRVGDGGAPESKRPRRRFSGALDLPRSCQASLREVGIFVIAARSVVCFICSAPSSTIGVFSSGTFQNRSSLTRGNPPEQRACGCVVRAAPIRSDSVKRELRGSQGMGVVSSNPFDCVLLSTLYTFKPSC